MEGEADKAGVGDVLCEAGAQRIRAGNLNLAIANGYEPFARGRDL